MSPTPYAAKESCHFVRLFAIQGEAEKLSCSEEEAWTFVPEIGYLCQRHLGLYFELLKLAKEANVDSPSTE